MTNTYNRLTLVHGHGKQNYNNLPCGLNKGFRLKFCESTNFYMKHLKKAEGHIGHYEDNRPNILFFRYHLSKSSTLKMSNYDVKDIKIIESYYLIERFIISTKRNFRCQNNFKKFRIQMTSLFVCFVNPTSFCWVI